MITEQEIRQRLIVDRDFRLLRLRAWERAERQLRWEWIERWIMWPGAVAGAVLAGWELFKW